ncbi:MAG: adenylyl-sulfate reductase subunit alpha [Bacillota bacterium]
MKLSVKTIETDALVIGGGTAGCFSALTIVENSDLHVVIAEKANIKRSGCLAAGVNALNAYIGKGETPESFLEYVKKDSEDVIREDLVYSIAKRLNKAVERLESLGLPILKDDEGNYVLRGKRSIKINGENIKPIIAQAVMKQDRITVMNRLNIVDYLKKGDKVIGAIGFSLEEDTVYIIYAKTVICTTGGAAGLYKPNNPEFSRHKMWYSPFNTGAGYAMGIRAGAEMTTFEMRFIALRCKDTIAPTGTVAQGIEAEQINSKGETYVEKYGKPTTPMRLYATVMENQKGNGPCFLKTKGISEEEEKDIFKAYLNMAPAQTLKWLERNTGPSQENIEIEGTEPYIVGGHTASGYWIDQDRRTTLKGLYAAGDVAGGSPKKYVTGCMAEGEMAALAVIKDVSTKLNKLDKLDEDEMNKRIEYIQHFFQNPDGLYNYEEIEMAMQKVMDQYGGGISAGYRYNEEKLIIAAKRIDELLELSNGLKANNFHELLFILEVIDRLYVCKVLIQHLRARKETRWKCYQENGDFQEKDNKNWKKYVNSVYKNHQVETFYRDLIGRDERYEHTN